MTHKPPKWIDRVLEWYCHPAFIDEIKGDLYESFWKWRVKRGPFQAGILYAFNTFLFMRMYNSRFSQTKFQSNKIVMLGHLLKVSYRNFRKYKSYNLANILGLTAGVAISTIMLLHIEKELSYEQSYPKHDRIARVSMQHEWAKSSPVFAEELQNFYSNLDAVGRFARYGGVNILSRDLKKFTSKNVFQADQPTINIFDYEFIHGSPKGALDRPETIVLTEKVAVGLFGDENPIGETVEINDVRKFEVTGVIRNLPDNSHIKSDAFVSMPTFYKNMPENWLESRGWMVMYTYVLMNQPSDFEEIRDNLPEFRKKYREDEDPEELAHEDRMEIMRLTDIHLNSDKIQEMGQNSSMVYIYVFGILAAIIISIACVNFINIFTILAFKRTKEVGMRKVIGASRQQLITQLLSEAVLSSWFAFGLGLGICLVALPYYNSIAELSIAALDVLTLNNMLLFFASSTLLGLLSGLYPALMVTHETISSSLAAGSNPNAKFSVLRKGLIVFQFVLSVFVLISTVAVYQQMNFIQTSNTGYNAEQIASVGLYGKFFRQVRDNRQTIFNQFDQIPGVKNVSLTSNIIGEPLSVEGFKLSGTSDDDSFSPNMVWVDENYLDVMGIELAKGTNFNNRPDSSIAFLINEKLAAAMGENVLGQLAEAIYRDDKGPIVGVVKDYHYYSLHQSIEPLVLCFKPRWAGNLLIKMEGQNPIETLTTFEQQVKEHAPNTLFHYNFLDEQINNLYKGENTMFKVFKVFTVLALIISCVGLLGLAAMEVQRRTKEVGIRKVLGASAPQIFRLLSKQFVTMIAISVFLGIPISYLAIDKWLTNFSYQIPMSWEIFMGPSVVMILLSLLIVTGHVLKTVMANPVKSLRYE